MYQSNVLRRHQQLLGQALGAQRPAAHVHGHQRGLRRYGARLLHLLLGLLRLLRQLRQRRAGGDSPDVRIERLAPLLGRPARDYLLRL